MFILHLKLKILFASRFHAISWMEMAFKYRMESYGSMHGVVWNRMWCWIRVGYVL